MSGPAVPLWTVALDRKKRRRIVLLSQARARGAPPVRRKAVRTRSTGDEKIAPVRRLTPPGRGGAADAPRRLLGTGEKTGACHRHPAGAQLHSGRTPGHTHHRDRQRRAGPPVVRAAARGAGATPAHRRPAIAPAEDRGHRPGRSPRRPAGEAAPLDLGQKTPAFPGSTRGTSASTAPPWQGGLNRRPQGRGAGARRSMRSTGM